jgi:hypothetical protein
MQEFSQIPGLPIDRVFDLARLIDRVQPELEAFNKAILAMRAQYGITLRDGSFEIPAESKAEADQALERLNAREIELDVQKITQEELVSCKGLTPAMVYQLSWLIELGGQRGETQNT